MENSELYCYYETVNMIGTCMQIKFLNTDGSIRIVCVYHSYFILFFLSSISVCLYAPFEALKNKMKEDKIINKNDSSFSFYKHEHSPYNYTISHSGTLTLI